MNDGNDIGNQVLSKVTLRLLPFMFVLYIMSYLDRINVSFAGLEMNRDLGFTDEVFGFGTGVFFIGYFLFGIPSNLMVERFGARRWISTIMVAWGAVSVLMAWVRSDIEFYLLRFLLGVTEAGFFPGMILYLTYWFPKNQHGLAVARFMTAIPAAGVIGALVASQALQMTGLLGLPGWKWLFIVTGLPSVFLGIAVFFYLTDKPEHAGWLEKNERDWLIDTIQQEKSTAAISGGGTIFDAIMVPRVWHMAVLYFSVTLGMYGFQLWLPQIIHSMGKMTDSQTALLSAIPAIFQALGMVLIAANSDRTGERRKHVAFAAILASCGFVATGYAKTPEMGLAMLSATAFGIWAAVGPFWALATGYLPPAAAAAGIGLINSVGNLGGFAGPYLIGAIKMQTHDFTAALVALAFSLAIAAVLALAAAKPAVK